MFRIYLLLSLLCLFSFQTSWFQAHALAPPSFLLRRRSHCTLFSSNRNDPHKQDDPPNDEEEEEDDDFNWLQGLSRWPLYPSKLQDTEEEWVESSTSSEEQQRKGGFIPIPLANLINVEAILLMNGEDTLERESDLELYTRGTALLNETSTSPSTTNTTTSSTGSTNTSALTILPDLEELANWEKLANTIKLPAIGGTTDAILKEASNRIEYFVNGASTAISPTAVAELVQRAGRALSSQDTDFVKVATNIAREQGLNVSEAAERAKETTEYTTNLVKLANGLLQNGYARGDVKKKENTQQEKDESKPLFSDFDTAKTISPNHKKSLVAKTAELGSICGAIYQETIPRTLGLGHSIVGNGTTEDVSWMVTDCIAKASDYQEDENDDDNDGDKSLLVRTITVRGFDASDESIDRELLLNRICTATPETLENGVLVHGGLMEIARAIYNDVKQFIDFTAPQHKLVLTGHSVGGSLSIMLLFLMVQDKGVEFVREKVLRVFSFGSPPVTTMARGLFDGNVEEYLGSIDGIPEEEPERDPYMCDILTAFGLPSTMVYGFVQPWDPIVRLFSEIDPLYPLLGDLGDDNVTVYASGPPRTLRPITRAIVESWEGWPLFRDTFRATVSQNYTSVGIQHILLPDSVRYLSDRFVAANINVPPMEHMLRISSKQLLPSLEKNFPLDTFRISFVPTAIRAFVHHFYPAYGFPIVDFANKKLKRQAVSKNANDGEKQDYRIVLDKAEDTLFEITGSKTPSKPNGKEKENKENAKGGRWSAPGWLQKKDSAQK